MIVQRGDCREVRVQDDYREIQIVILIVIVTKMVDLFLQVKEAIWYIQLSLVFSKA